MTPDILGLWRTGSVIRGVPPHCTPTVYCSRLQLQKPQKLFHLTTTKISPMIPEDSGFTPPRLTTTAGFLASPSQALFPIPLNYNSPLCDQNKISVFDVGSVQKLTGISKG